MLCFIFLPRGGHRDEVSHYEAFLIDSILTKRWIHLGYLMMMHMIACCDITTKVFLYRRFISLVFKEVDIDLSKKTNFEAPSIYDTYNDHSMGKMKFEKALDDFWIRKAKRAPTQARGQGQAHLGVEEKTEIREMEGGVDPQGGVNPQSGHQPRQPELDISLLQTEILSQTGGVQFESTFSKPMTIEPTFTKEPSTQPSNTRSSFFGPTFTKPTYTEVPQPQAPPTPDYAPLMDLSTQISFFGTHMEELTMVNDTCFYSMEDRMDRYQTRFTYQFEYL